MLQRAGLLGPGDASRVQAHAREHGVATVEAVIALRLADEDALVSFCQSKLMIPVVRAAVLQRVEPETAARITPALAWEHQVLPVSADDVGNLTLAMADPTDLRAVEAVAAHTGAYLVRAVAPLSALRAALLHIYGPRIARADAPLPPPPPPAAFASAREELTRTPEDVEDAPPIVPLSSVAFARILPALVATTDRDQVTELLLDFLAAGFDRVLLFVHAHGLLRGRDARGDDVLTEAVRKVRIPAGAPSVFNDVIVGGRAYFGRWPTQRTIDKAFARAMGGMEGDVLVLPVRLRDKVPLLVYADGLRHPLDPGSINALVDAVSRALERIIFQRKAQS